MEIIEAINKYLTNDFLKIATDPEQLKNIFIVGLLLALIFNFLFFINKKLTLFKDIREEKKLPNLAINKEKIIFKKIATIIPNNKLFKSFKFLLVLNFIIIIFSFYSGYEITTQVAGVKSPRNPALGETVVNGDSPLKVIFDRPVNNELLNYEIAPEVEGHWDFISSSFGPLVDTLIFTPKETLDPETRYTISLKNIKSILGSQEEDFMFSFLTPPLPSIESTSLDVNSEGILPNQEILIFTDKDINNTAKFSVNINPEVETILEQKNENEFILKANNKFKKSTKYTLEVQRTQIKKDFTTGEEIEVKDKETVYSKDFSTIEAPGVKSYNPKGSGILTNANISIEFKQDMNKKETENAFSFSPNVSGDITWEGNRKLIFNPSSDLKKNTSYTYSVSTEAKALDNSPFEESFSNTFTTIGYVKISGFYPYNKQSNVSPSQKISVTFNQAVDHSSAQNKFSISPNVSGSFSWSGNTMYYNHSGFSYYKKYTVSVGSGIKSIHGLDGTTSASITFTTKQQSITLNVPSYSQQHMYSCMAAAARGALAYKGAYVSEDYLLSLIGYDNTPFSGSWGDPNATWGDPYSGVVGNVDGKSGGVNWGYGAYWGPTANAISKYRPTEIKTGWNVQGIAQEISKGNPVLVWWVNGVWPAYTVRWKTPSGKNISGVNSMHIQTVKGFTGTVDNPTSFIVNDSGYGYPSRTFSISTFMAKWSWFGNSAVIVK